MKQSWIAIKQPSNALLITPIHTLFDDLNGPAVDNKANFLFLIGFPTQSFFCWSDFKNQQYLLVCML